MQRRWSNEKNHLTKQVLSFQNCFPKPEIDRLTAVPVVDLKTLIRTILQISFTFEEIMLECCPTSQKSMPVKI